MPYIAVRFKEEKYDELRDHLIRQDNCETRVKTARKALAEVVAELRELKEVEATIIREIRSGKPDDRVEAEQPLIAAAERNAGAGDGQPRAPRRMAAR